MKHRIQTIRQRSYEQKAEGFANIGWCFTGRRNSDRSKQYKVSRFGGAAEIARRAEKHES